MQSKYDLLSGSIAGVVLKHWLKARLTELKRGHPVYTRVTPGSKTHLGGVDGLVRGADPWRPGAHHRALVTRCVTLCELRERQRSLVVLTMSLNAYRAGVL